MSSPYQNYIVELKEDGGVTILWHVPGDRVKKIGWRYWHQPKPIIIGLSPDAAREHDANIDALRSLSHWRRTRNTSVVLYVHRYAGRGAARRIVMDIVGERGYAEHQRKAVKA